MLDQLLSHSLPAPYMMAQSHHMAHGGHSKKHKMILAHFNRSELDELDRAQGHRREDHTTGMRKYDKLEALLENPHLMRKIAHHTREHHYAMGGHPMGPIIDQMRHDGRLGDTEMGMIGPRTEHILNHMAGGGSTNPYDGKKEYFLASLLSGLGSSLLPGITKGLGGFARGLGNWDSSKGFGDNLKNAALGGLKSAFGSTDEEGNTTMPSMYDVGNSALRGAGAMMNARNQGQDWNQAAMQGARAGMEGYNSPVARFGQGMLDSRMGGQDWGRSAMRGGADAMQGAENPMIRGAGSMLNARHQGQDWGRSAMRGGMEASQGIDNPMVRGARGMMGGRLAGQNMQQSFGRGMQAATRGMNSNNPYVQGMQGMGESMQQGHGMGRSAMRGAQDMMGGMQRQQRQQRQAPRYIPQEENYFNELPYGGEEEYAA